MTWKPGNTGRQMAQQAQQRAHHHNQQFARKQMQGLQDQWRARQVYLGAQMQARERQEGVSAQPDNEPRYREGWSSGPPEPPADGVPRPQGAPRRASGAGSGNGVFMGEARNIDRNQEQGRVNYQRQIQVLTFRVDCRDSAGNLQQSVPVLLRGQRIVGNVREGEQVEVRGRPGRDGVVRVKSFWNVATQSNVTGGGLFIFSGGGGSLERGRAPSPLGAGRLGRLAVLVAAIVFTVSVTMLTGYVNNGTGGKSLLQATSGDLASPLYPKDFRVLIVLVAVVFAASIVSMGMYRRSLMIVAAAASLGLIGYTLHISQIGRFPGFGPYGSPYWLSLLAAAVMALGAIAAAAARSDY